MKRWIVKPKKSNDIIDQLLINRNIKDKESFLNPNYDRDLYNPFLFKDMQKAVERISTAIEKKEKIGIFGDYDADGISGTAILYNFFRKINVDTEVYIPSREEGYGLNKDGIKILGANNCKLLITVDLGITGKKEVEFAKSLGMDVIITDHHEIQKELFPKNAFAVIHPDLQNQKYPNKFLSGGGVAWKLTCALSIFFARLPHLNGAQIDSRQLKWSLDLAAISTICDMVPLAGENRIIAKYGLIVLSKTKNLGLGKLYEVAAINKNAISSYTVGFQIGPRINAPGRMDHSQASFYLLTTENESEADKIARKLNNINKDRQDELERVLNEARAKIEKRGLKNKKIIVLEDENWPSGIVGLVAGRIMEEFSRPTIVLGEHEGKFKGSGRSIDGFHLLEALEQARKYLIGFGGHAKAAGLHLEKEHLSFLYDELLEIADKKIKSDDLVSKITIDVEIEPKDISSELYENIKKFEPYGMGNSRPIFLIKNLIIDDLCAVGAEGKHLKLKLSAKNQESIISFDAIGFDFGSMASQLTEGEVIDIVFTLDKNVWNNRSQLQFKILDLKKN